MAVEHTVESRESQEKIRVTRDEKYTVRHCAASQGLYAYSEQREK